MRRLLTIIVLGAVLAATGTVCADDWDYVMVKMGCMGKTVDGTTAIPVIWVHPEESEVDILQYGSP